MTQVRPQEEGRTARSPRPFSGPLSRCGGCTARMAVRCAKGPLKLLWGKGESFAPVVLKGWQGYTGGFTAPTSPTSLVYVGVGGQAVHTTA